MYLFGEVLVINFPFSDGIRSKRRPVMVIKDTADNDILIAKITSQVYDTEFDVCINDGKRLDYCLHPILEFIKFKLFILL